MPASASPPPSPPVRTPGQQPSHPASATNRSRTPQNDRFALYSPRNPDRRWIRAYIAAAESAVAAFDRIVPPAGAVALHAYLREFAAGAVDAARELGAVAARGSDFELASGSRAFDADIDRLSHTLFTEELRDEEEAVNIYIKRCTSG